MIPNAPSRTVTGSLGGEKIAMQFDTKSLAHLMGLLTNLYSDQELAILREYSTNAWDAHVECGQTRPIEVSTPSLLDMNVRIRDYGRGLSVHDIKTIYSLYGASTKRDSNDYNGMMGIGGKSALTYTGQFTIISWHNGRKIGVSVSVETDGTPVMEIVYDIESDEPTGVEIIVPSRTGSKFEVKAKEFFRFWKPGRVLLNEEDPSIKNANWISDDIALVSKDKYDEIEDRVVMGNVSYPVNRRFSKKKSYGYRDYFVVAYVPNGAVNFTPSREELMYTPLTEKTLDDLAVGIDNKIQARLQRQIDQMSKKEAVTFASNWAGFSFKYEGHDMPSSINNTWECSEYRNYKVGLVDTEARKSGSISALKLLSDQKVIIYGFTPKTFTRIHKDKINQWAKGRSITTALVFDELPTEDFMFWNDSVPVSWDSIKHHKSSLEKKKKAEWKVEIWDDNGVVSHGPAKDISNTDILYFFHQDRLGNYPMNPNRLAPLLDPGTVLVKIVPSKEAKFKELHPSARHYKDWTLTGYNIWKNSVSEDDKKALSLRAEGRRLTTDIFYLDPTQVVDPKLSQYIKMFAKSEMIAERLNREESKWIRRLPACGLYRIPNLQSTVGEFQDMTDLDSYVANCYPLVKASHKEASYAYIESIYNNRRAVNE